METNASSSKLISITTRPPQVGEAISYMDKDLFKAAEDGHMELFNKYEGDLLRLVDGILNTALHIYSKTGGGKEKSVNFVEQLVDKCPSLLTQPNARGEIPMHVAARHGHSGIVKFIIECTKQRQHDHSDLENGASTLEETGTSCMTRQMLKMTDNKGNTPLHMAVESGNRVVVGVLVKVLKELEPEFSFPPNKSGETPIYLAVKKKDLSLVAEILDNWKSVSMNYGGPDGKTALHAAVMAGNKSIGIVEKLIETKNDLTKQTDNKGRTPLHYAAHLGHVSIAKVLLKVDASAACIRDKESESTALHMAACQSDVQIMKDIIAHCPSCCEIVDKNDWNFLHFASVALTPPDLSEILFDGPRSSQIRNLLLQKDVNDNTPLAIIKLGPLEIFFGYNQFVGKLRRFGYEEHYESLTAKKKWKQIRKIMKEVGENIDVGGKPTHHFFVEVEVRDRDKEAYVKARSDANLLVATLVATVTFTAAFTMPGGYKSETGAAALSHDSAFKVFAISDTIAFVFSLIAIFFHFLVSLGFLRVNFQGHYLCVADCLTVAAMAAMVIAFSTGTYAVLQSSSGLAIATCSLGLAFFPGLILSIIFILVYFRSDLH